MRKIKTTLRVVRNTALLFAAASGMTYITSCKSDDIEPNDPVTPTPEEVVEVSKLSLKAGTNPELARTYYNSHMATRAAFDVPEHKGMPKNLPTSYDVTLTNGFMANEWACEFAFPAQTPEFDPKSIGAVEQEQGGNKIYVLDSPNVYAPAGTYKSLPDEFLLKYSAPDYNYGENNSQYQQGWSKEIKVKNPKYFIDGEVTVGGFGGNENNKRDVYILNGGKLSVGTNIPYATTIYLYKGGDILKARNAGEIYHKGTLIAEEDLVHPDVDITIEGNVYTYGKIQGKNVTLNTKGEVFAGCAVTAAEKIYLTNEGRICAGYVSAPTIKLDSNAKILLRDGGYMRATEKLDLENIGNNCMVYAEEEEYAMIETKTIKVNLIDLQGSFYNLAVKFDNATGDNRTGDKGEGLLWNQSVMLKGSFTATKIEDKDCGPKVEIIPVVSPFENIGSVEPTYHNHPISATCIFTNGKDAYLSWHTQGGLFHGCIEYLTVENGKVTLNGFLETNPAGEGDNNIDFNHVIYDNGKIFVAGDHQKKGGVLGWIECNNGGFVSYNATLNLYELYNGQGGSGNCIIRNGNYYQVASIKGFETFNVSDFDNGNRPKAVARLAAYDFDPSKNEATSTGKHIATDGNKVVMLTLINRDKAANTAKASIKVYNASDVNYEKEVASYVINDAVLAPVDGKDVIAISGDDIWVCLGKGGVQHLKLAGNTISKVSEFVLANQNAETVGLTSKERAAAGANGLAVDGQYVYVAHGGAGLVVLNKEDLSFIGRTRNNGGNSANYVNLNPDGYIYVAYGKSNVQVYAWKKN